MNNLIKENQKIIFNKLNELVPNDKNVLTKAIRYCLLQKKAKRLRPLLIIETAKLFNIKNINNVIIVACAIEMIHTFSLIHDDLPAMDNDDYRRGELTCHKKFSEYNAILSGDSLIPLSIETILTKTTLTDSQKNQIILSIVKAIGYKGMCLGQSLDIDFEKNNKNKSSMIAEKINIYKTGYLFQSCIEIGCILGNAKKNEKEKLNNYSLYFGKAFQLRDDLKDNEINKKDIKKVKNKIFEFVKKGKEEIKNIKNIDKLNLIIDFCLSDI